MEYKDWPNIAEDILKYAQTLGANAAEVNIANNTGFSVQVRLGDIELVERTQDKGIDITVYFQKRTGTASTSDLDMHNIKETVAAACQIAQYTQEDPYTGLLDPAYLASSIPDLHLHHPWNITIEDAAKMALDCENQAKKLDKRIINTEGASVNTYVQQVLYANTHNFMGSYETSMHSISCSLIAQDAFGMQRDMGFSIARNPKNLRTPEEIAQEATTRAIRRLNPRKIKTQKAPVIFESSVANTLLAHFIGAISGSNIYKKTSFLHDQLGQQIFPSFMSIFENPHLIEGLGSTPFDSEGGATYSKNFLTEGILNSYVLNSYTARKLNLLPTGNAGGIYNLRATHQGSDLNALIKKMDTGLLVTELLGQGVNIMTGDYSRGVVGLWVENGMIQYPVEEITIAANLKNMFKQIVDIATDIDARSNICTGSILIEEMMIAGS